MGADLQGREDLNGSCWIITLKTARLILTAQKKKALRGCSHGAFKHFTSSDAHMMHEADTGLLLLISLNLLHVIFFKEEKCG